MAIRHPAIASKAAKAAKAARVAKARRHAAEGKNTVETPLSKSYTDPRDVLLKPVVSEKSYALLDENKYTFIVDPNANKTQIKQAVQAVFDVKVTGVNTINRQGKRKRTKTGFGQRAGSKRAIVTSPRRPYRHLRRSDRLRAVRIVRYRTRTEKWESASTSRLRRAVVAPASPTSSRSRGPRRRSRWSVPCTARAAVTTPVV